MLVDRLGRVVLQLDDRLVRLPDEGINNFWQITIYADEMTDDEGMRVMFEYLPGNTGVDIEIVYG